jgi:hypothetical protein
VPGDDPAVACVDEVLRAESRAEPPSAAWPTSDDETETIRQLEAPLRSAMVTRPSGRTVTPPTRWRKVTARPSFPSRVVEPARSPSVERSLKSA